MKILRITVSNLASIAGTHSIDFTREPLLSTGLYAISGPTGSGKTTLLDALCLALYDKTPRLALVGSSEEICGIQQKDPRNLLRRGCASGFADVAFVGVDGNPYSARWSVRRSRGNADGNLQATGMSFRSGSDLDGQQILASGRKTDTLEAIGAKVGLSFEQFTRAVLLAQNDFATFLQANDRDRAGILEALTGTERFAAISRAVHDRCTSMEKDLDALRSRLEGAVPMTLEARAEAESALVEATRDHDARTEAIRIHREHIKWFADFAGFEAACTAGQSAFDDARKALDAAAPRRDELSRSEIVARDGRPLRNDVARTREVLAACEKTLAQSIDAKAVADKDFAAATSAHTEADKARKAAKTALDAAADDLRAARTLDGEVHAATQALETARKEERAAIASLEEATRSLTEIRKSRTVLERQRDDLAIRIGALASWEPFVTDSAAWAERLSAAARAHKEQAEASRHAIAARQAIDACLKAQSEAEARKAPLARALTEADAARASAARALAAFDAMAINEERTAASTMREDLRILRTRLEKISDKADAHAELARNLEADNKALEDQRAEQARIAADLPAAEAAATEAINAWELARLAIGDDALRLRATLIQDCPCPVCGSREHPFGAHAPAKDAAILDSLGKNADQRKRARDAMRTQQATLAKTIPAAERDCNNLARQCAKAGDELAKLRATPAASADEQSILDRPEPERIPALDECIRRLDATIASCDRRLSDRAKAESLRDRAAARHEAARKDFEQQEKTIADAIHATGLARQEERSATRRLDEAAVAESTAVAALAPLLDAIDRDRRRLGSDPDALARDLAKATRSLAGLKDENTRVKTNLNAETLKLDTQSDILKQAEATCASRSATARERADELAHRTAARKALLGGRPADDFESDLARSLDQAADAFEDAARHHTRALTAQAAAATALTGAIDARDKAAEARTRATKAFEDWKAAFAAANGIRIDDTDIDRFLARDDSWIETERASLAALDASLTRAQGTLDERRRTLDAHLGRRPTQDDEASLQARGATLGQELADAVERKSMAEATLIRDNDTRARNSDLVRRIADAEAAVAPWSKLDDFIGSADGAKFRNIAQRRTLDILLAHANAQLGRFAGRYRLERVPRSLNILVVDTDMGDERRGVHSLSGGESFLVSLALALGLASLASNRLRIESLFIDEGFGSLDTATLNTAMSALMHLEAQGRKVGVISHVSEMADAIAVQVRLEKTRNGASRIILPGGASGEIAIHQGAGAAAHARRGPA